MKFKIIFILFNIVVIFSLLIVTLMPFFMLGGEYSQEFFIDSWYLFLIFLIAIGSIDTYFIINWKMFSLLESENWDELTLYLEMIIYKKNNLFLPLVKILANTYLIKSDMSGIIKLENYLRKEKPGLLKKMVIPLSVPRFIDGNSDKMEAFFAEFVDQKGVAKAEWVKFLYSFSLLLNNKRDAASISFLSLCSSKISPILKLLVIYSLNPFSEIENNGKFACVSLEREKLRSQYKREKMELELTSINDNVLVLVLNKFSKEAVDWLYKDL
ncbi:MAG: hypothetical protein U9N32_07145 [Spirochaetota bacterium]|nr:hypothetical protein [Spirochaetota bacterium]